MDMRTLRKSLYYRDAMLSKYYLTEGNHHGKFEIGRTIQTDLRLTLRASSFGWTNLS